MLSRCDIIHLDKDIFNISLNCLLYSNYENQSKTNEFSNEIECIQCQNGFYLDEGECIKINGCINPLLNQSEHIIQCDGDKFLGYSKKSFFDCPQNCISCKKDDDDDIHCSQCKLGYAKKDDEACVINTQYCSFADFEDFTFQNSKGEQVTKELMKCKECQIGYIQQELENKDDGFFNECVSCSQILNNCNSCYQNSNNQITCDSCNDGYYKYSENGQDQCIQCSQNCEFCSFEFINYYVPFPESNPQKGKEKREICLKCKTGYGFHYDGKSCEQCKQCDQCYYMVNQKFIYTLGIYFKAFTQQLIADNQLQFDLKCYIQTCSDGCLDQLDSCQTKYSISGCSLCAMQRSDQDKQNGLTCKQCFSDKQMKVLSVASLQNQYCLDICTPACRQCEYDINLKIMTCNACLKQGPFQLEYKQAIENLNTQLSQNDKIEIPSGPIVQYSLFLQKNKLTRKCLNCLFGCYQCSQDPYFNTLDNIYQNSIQNKNTNKQKVELLTNLYPQYFQLSQFQFPSQDAIDIVNSICSKCQPGYQLISPQMKCIKCDDNKFCKYSLKKIQYDLKDPKYDQDYLDDIFDLLVGIDFININNYYKVNQLNIQEIEIEFLLGPKTYSFNGDYSLNLSYMKSGKVLVQAKLKFNGVGQETKFVINNNFSILFFSDVEFTNMSISINYQKNLIYGGFEDFNSLLFQNVLFESFEKTGSIILISDISKLSFDQCQFKSNTGSIADFIQLIDPLSQQDGWEDPNYEEKEEYNLEISITNNYFYSDFQLTKCFLDTKDFSNINLNLNIINNQFLGPTIGCFISIQTSLPIDNLNYLSRNILIQDNYFNVFMYTGSTFFKDTTVDYVTFQNNTIAGIFLNKINDQSTTMFSFFQGNIYDTRIASINVTDSEFYLFEFTGTKDQSNIFYCIDPKIKIKNFTTFIPQTPPIFPKQQVEIMDNQNQNKSNQNNLPGPNIRILNLFKLSDDIQLYNKQNLYRFTQQQPLEQGPMGGPTYPEIFPPAPINDKEPDYSIKTLNPLFIIRENNNNKQKVVQVSNINLKNVSISGDNNPLFDFENVFVVKFNNITLKDSIIFGNIFKIKSHNFTANDILIDNSQKNFTLFLIESFNLAISNLTFSKELSQTYKLPQLIQLEYPESDDTGEAMYYKDCDFEECKNSNCTIEIGECKFGKGQKKCDQSSGYRDICILKSSQNNQENGDKDKDQNKENNEDEEDSEDIDDGETRSSVLKDDLGECIQDKIIVYDELSYDSGEYYKEIIIKDIFIKDLVMKSVLMNINNPKRNVQKIIIENIKLNNVVFDQDGQNYMESIPLLFNINSPQSVFIMKNVSITDFFPVDCNLSGDLKRFIHSFLQIEAVYLFIKDTQIINKNTTEGFPYSSQCKDYQI